jgi:hypothetical protein
VIIDLKGFAGRFLSGLKRLQRLLRYKRRRIVRRQPSQDTILSTFRPAAIPQPTFAPHQSNTPHASILTKSTVTPSPTYFFTSTPNKTHPYLRHRRRDDSRPHPTIESRRLSNLYKHANSGPIPSRSGAKRSYSATRSHVPRPPPLRDVPNREPPSSASLHPGNPSAAYSQPPSHSVYPTRPLRKMPSRPDLKSDNTWSTVASTCIYIIISSHYLTSWHPRCFASHAIPRCVPPTIQPAYASSLCLFTSSSRAHPVRRGPSPVSSDRFGFYFALSGPCTHSCPACYRSTYGGPRSTRSQVSQIPMDDRRQSQLTFQQHQAL